MSSPSSTFQVIDSPSSGTDDTDSLSASTSVDGNLPASCDLSTGDVLDLSGLLVNDEEVLDVLQGDEPGASHQDCSLFLADSFEDLSTEVIDDKKIDGECSSRTHSVLVTASTKKDLPGVLIPDPVKENIEYALHSPTTADEEKVYDEARQTRVKSVHDVERHNSTEDMHDPQWVQHKTHVFILSEAGKPIYTRYGNEENLVTMMGLMQAIVSFVQDGDDSIRCLIAGSHKFVFLVRGPIILVAVCSGQQSTNQLVLQLTYVYHQVLSVLTFTQLTRIFEQRRNYDLRKLLAGTEKFIDNLLNIMSYDPSFLLQSVRCLPLASTTRDIIGQALQQAKDKELVFSILIVKNQLVTMVRPKKFHLHPSDLHLIFNLVSSSTAFQAAESWTPICLPRFDNSGYLYAHVSYLDDQENCPVCLLLLSTDRNAFFELSECKKKIEEKLQKHKCIEQLAKAAEKGNYTVDEVGIPELWHFIYKSRSTTQFTAPEIGAPYVTTDEQERLYGLYLYLHHRIHSGARALKMLCYSTKTELMLGWVTSGFELYTTFSPLTSKETAMNAANKLLRWVKKEEDTLFILNTFTF